MTRKTAAQIISEQTDVKLWFYVGDPCDKTFSLILVFHTPKYRFEGLKLIQDSTCYYEIP